VPCSLGQLLQRCLARNPGQRETGFGQSRLDLPQATRNLGPASALEPVGRRTRWLRAQTSVGLAGIHL